MQSQNKETKYTPHSGQSIFDRFQELEIVEMTLTADLDSLINVRNTKEYTKAKVSYKDELGVTQNYNVKVRPRGRFRRRVCDMPPLKLKISKKQLEAAGLSKHNDLKLVTHCLDDESGKDNLVLREYLAYQLFEALTPQSFRTQLARITYQDDDNPDFQMTRYGFLIEDVDELAERIGGKECKDCYGLPKEQYQNSAEHIVSLFQFMVGNTDWSLEMNRNVKQIRMPGGDYIPVPYDFDFSVLVGAPYLRPNGDLNQTAEMERIFLGHAKNVKEIYSTLAYFKTKEGELIDIVRGFKFLNREERYDIEMYLKSFFEHLKSKGTAKEMIFENRPATMK